LLGASAATTSARMPPRKTNNTREVLLGSNCLEAVLGARGLLYSVFTCSALQRAATRDPNDDTVDMDYYTKCIDGIESII
jgi:hypothetical protein